MKQKWSSLVCGLGLVLALTGCSTSVPLAQRAIVKAIYLDETDQGVQAAIAVQTCTPSANAGDASSEIQLFVGEGGSIAAALSQAEQQQNKKPFYAQNRLLFLGKGAVKAGASQYLSYFGAEALSRTNLAVFVLPMSAQELIGQAESLEMLVGEGERLAEESPVRGNRTQGVYEVNFAENGGFTGYLPVLRMAGAQNSPAQVTELLLFGADKPLLLAQGTSLQLCSLFAGKSQRLNLVLSLGGVETSVKTQSLFLQREMMGRSAEISMKITIQGKIEAVSQNGRLLQGRALDVALGQCNTYLSKAAQAIYADSFAKGYDLFADLFWFQQRDFSATGALLASDAFYTQSRVTIASQLKAG